MTDATKTKYTIRLDKAGERERINELPAITCKGKEYSNQFGQHA